MTTNCVDSFPEWLTVGQLIEKLSKLDPQKKALVDTGDGFGGIYSVGETEEDVWLDMTNKDEG